MAAGRGAGAVRPDARADVDEEADDLVTHKDADGADALPHVITDIRTDDHAST